MRHIKSLQELFSKIKRCQIKQKVLIQQMGLNMKFGFVKELSSPVTTDQFSMDFIVFCVHLLSIDCLVIDVFDAQTSRES